MCSRSMSTRCAGRPRSVGVEQVGLWALEQLDLPALLTRLGVNGALRSAATGAIVGRLAAPASERATHRWLQERSGLGELLGVDRDRRCDAALPRLGRAGEASRGDRGASVRPRDGAVRPTVTLYDLHLLEGEASDQPQAQRGHSKEKRSDCPLLTLGLTRCQRLRAPLESFREHRTLSTRPCT